MPDFDPYYEWLGIRDPQRPPNHYRLLGLDPFETDLEVIGHAADRQMAHVRSYQTGPQATVSQQLLNELAVARLCLTNPAKKAAYDAHLAAATGLAPPPGYAPQPQYAAPQQPVLQQPVPPGAFAAPYSQPQAPQSYYPPAAAQSAPQLSRPPADAPRKSVAQQQAEDEDAVRFKVQIPIGVYVLGVGLLGIALFAGFNIMREHAPKVEVAEQETEEPATKTDAAKSSKDKTEQTDEPQTELPPVADAVPADAQMSLFRGHTAGVTSVALSSDGSMAASAGQDKSVRWWRMGSGEQLGLFDRHGDHVTAIAFSRDSRGLLSSSLDKTVRLWDLGKEEQLYRMRGHALGVNAAIFLPDGRRALSGGTDGTLKMWNLFTGDLVRTYEGHTAPVHCLAAASNGRYAASGGSDATIRIWDLEGDAAVATFDLPERNVFSVAFSPDDTQLAYGASTGTVGLFSFSTGEELHSCYGHTAAVHGVEFIDNQRCVSAGDDGTIRIWSTLYGEQLTQYELSGTPVTDVAVSVNRDYLLTGAGDGSVRQWAIPALEEIPPESDLPLPPDQPPPNVATQIKQLTPHEGEATAVAFAHNDRQMLSAGSDGKLRVYALDRDFESELAYEVELGAPLFAARFGPRSDRIAVSGRGLLQIRSGLQAAQVLPLVGHTADVRHLQFVTSADERPLLVTADVERNVIVWNAETGQQVQKFTSGAYGDRWALAPDGTAATASFDRTVRLWKLPAGEETARWTVPGDSAWADAVALSPNGRMLLAGANDGRLHVLSPAAMSPVLRLVGHESRVLSLAVSPDSRRAISGGLDGSMILWNLPAGRDEFQFPRMTGAVREATFAAGGRYSLSADASGSVRLWKLPETATLEPNPDALVPAMVRNTPPTAEQLAAANKQVAEQHTANLAQLDAAARSALAGQLFIEALGVEDNPPLRYALILKSRDLSAQVGDLQNAFDAANALGDEFGADRLALAAEAIVLAAKAPQPRERQLQVASTALDYADRAVAAGDFASAAALLEAATALARRLSIAQFGGHVAERSQQAAAARAAYEQIAPSAERLRTDPASPADNLAVGKYYALERDDWPRARRYLALAENDAWRWLGNTLLAEPATPERQVEIARRLEALAGQMPARRDSLLRQAYLWAARAAESSAEEAQRAELAEYGGKLLDQILPVKGSLADLPAISANLGMGVLGTGGRLGYTGDNVNLVLVRSYFVRQALGTHPADNGTARVAYRLFGRLTSLRGLVAVNDTAALAPLASTLRFSIIADGEQIFLSETLALPGESQEFLLDLRDVDRLELVVTSNGPSLGAHAVWLQMLTRKRQP